MKRILIAVLLLTTSYLLLPGSLFAQYWTPEERRGLTPRYFQRDASLTWRYEWVSPKIGKSFSYFGQDYNLNLFGPLLFPALGKSKISLNYRLGKNIFGREWWNPLTDVDQRSLNYYISTFFSPPYLNRFFGLSFNYGRSTVNPGFREQVSEQQELGWRLTPPWTINLSKIFSRQNNRNRRQKSFILTLPWFYYSSRKDDTQQLSNHFNQRGTFQKLDGYWRISHLNLDYNQERNKFFDLLKEEKLTRETFSRYLSGSLSLITPLPGVQNAYFTGSYHQYQYIYPSQTLSESLSTSAVLLSRRVSFLRFTHCLQYANGMNWDAEKMVPQTFGHSLSLSSYRYLRSVYLSNILTYRRSSAREIKPVSQGISESLSWSLPFKRILLAGSVSQGYNWTDGTSKTLETRATKRVDLNLFKGIGTTFDCGYLEGKDLLAKKVITRSINANTYLSTEFKPFAYLLNFNNNNHNHNNNNNNDNFYADLLRLGFTYQVRFSRNLLTKASTIDYYETYTLYSAPFNNYLAISVVYKRIRGTSPYEELTTEVTSGTALQYKGITVKINIYSSNLQPPNVLVSLEYSRTTGGLSLGYRVLNIGTNNPVRVLSLSFTRKF